MKTTARFLAALLALMAAPAGAAFHLWSMTELFSSADGTVQFLELASPANGEGFVSGHRLTSTAAGTVNIFVFPNNLPSQTGGKRMLIATEGFAALGVVVPDFVVPNGFFSPSGGAVDFANVDTWFHPALPGGGQSLQRDGATAANSPTNFAGQTGSITTVEAQALNVQGLWYRAPAESESGWGMGIAHQGDTLFVTWFTYDLDGTQMWLVGSDVRRTTGNTYAGALYRTAGPAFNAVPFGAYTVNAVGSVTLHFTGAGSGTFTYTVNGVTQSKPITRQVFDTPPTCSPGGAPGATPNYTDLWYRAPAESEPGWGVSLAHQGEILFAAWFTYDQNGRGMWVVGDRLERTTGNTFQGPLYRTTGPAFNATPWSPAGVSASQVGTATFAFTDGSSGTFSYTVNGITQSKAITRQGFGTPPTVCR
ncbi:MAG TPA: hypothetical protein VFK48_07755 [Usitatibacter sp.]|nr:hypothetical protein [Usitatibacter sp.]